MMKFVADRLVMMRETLEEARAAEDDGGFTLQPGVVCLIGEIGGGVQMTRPIEEARENFRDELDLATQALTPGRYRSDEQRREDYQRAFVALRAYGTALEQAKPSWLAQHHYDTSEVENPVSVA